MEPPASALECTPGLCKCDTATECSALSSCTWMATENRCMKVAKGTSQCRGQMQAARGDLSKKYCAMPRDTSGDCDASACNCGDETKCGEHGTSCVWMDDQCKRSLGSGCAPQVVGDAAANSVNPTALSVGETGRCMVDSSSCEKFKIDECASRGCVWSDDLGCQQAVNAYEGFNTEDDLDARCMAMMMMNCDYCAPECAYFFSMHFAEAGCCAISYFTDSGMPVRHKHLNWIMNKCFEGKVDHASMQGCINRPKKGISMTIPGVPFDTLMANPKVRAEVEGGLAADVMELSKDGFIAGEITWARDTSQKFAVAATGDAVASFQLSSEGNVDTAEAQLKAAAANGLPNTRSNFNSETTSLNIPTAPSAPSAVEINTVPSAPPGTTAPTTASTTETNVAKTSDDDGDASLEHWHMALIGVGVLVVLGGLLALCFMQNKKNRHQHGQPYNNHYAAPEYAQTHGKTEWGDTQYAGTYGNQYRMPPTQNSGSYYGQSNYGDYAAGDAYGPQGSYGGQGGYDY
eukprot:NODE_623_length_1753_cov_61.861009_g613_i0.p1 GENE.NODE_623_length_1753_cov_61.861009_g613_i0~~NODE_623_length_1753_cov_61.861009_g613_i0.p1  ORF type:complete len:531 (-),score=151.93 NODE_623_length_1753_cov_61.861009_g613_i0:160-1713(-)